MLRSKTPTNQSNIIKSYSIPKIYSSSVNVWYAIAGGSTTTGCVVADGIMLIFVARIGCACHVEWKESTLNAAKLDVVSDGGTIIVGSEVYAVRLRVLRLIPSLWPMGLMMLSLCKTSMWINSSRWWTWRNNPYEKGIDCF